jgi:hypothetical protein
MKVTIVYDNCLSKGALKTGWGFRPREKMRRGETLEGAKNGKYADEYLAMLRQSLSEGRVNQ